MAAAIVWFESLVVKTIDIYIGQHEMNMHGDSSEATQWTSCAPIIAFREPAGEN